MKKYNTGLLVGRFQPFHKGHLYLIQKSLHYIDTLIIGVGSANKHDQDNPLNFEERKEMLERVIVKEKLKTKIIEIVPLNDFHNDGLWLKNTLGQTGLVDVIVGNNEWTNGIFERAGYPILRLGFYKRYIYEGERIRRLMREGKNWETRVPAYLIKYIKTLQLIK